MVIRNGAAALAAALLLAGCGGSQRLTPIEQAALLGHIDDARDSAAAGDLEAFRDAIGDLRREVDRFEEAGELSSSSAEELKAAATATMAAAERRLEAASTPDPEATPLLGAPTATVTEEPNAEPPPRPEDAENAAEAAAKAAEKAAEKAERAEEKEARAAEKAARKDE